MAKTPDLIWLSFFTAALTLCNAATTCSIGADNPTSAAVTMNPTPQNDTAFFLQGAPSPCCGKLKNWKYHITDPTAVGQTIKAQLWRSTGGGNYDLIAQESLAIGSSGLNTQNAVSPEADVEIGDIVGWDVDAGVPELIPYDTASGYDVQSNTLGSVSVGNNIPWGQTPVTRAYAFGAAVTQNEPPVIVDSDVTHSDSALPTVFATLGITDTESADPATDLTITLQTNSYFILDGLDVKESTPGSVPAGVYTLEVTAEDNCDITTGTVTITITGTAPTFNLPATHGSTYSDDYNSATPTNLFTIVVTDTDPDTCSTTNTKFTIDNSAPPNYDLFLNAGADLNFDNGANELVDVTCTDVSGLTVTGTYTVPLSDAAPTSSGLPLTTTVDDEFTGALPGTFTCEDSDDTLIVSFNPAQPMFTIDDSAAPTYSISVVGPLNYDDATSHTLTVECTDDDATPATVTVGTYTVTVTDKPPVATGGSGTASDGTQAATTSVGSFTCDDGHDTCACSVSDAVRFEISGTQPNFEVSVKSGATLSTAESPLTLVLSCTDGTTTVTNNFDVVVTDTAPAWVTAPGTSDYALPDNTLAAPATELGSFSLTDPSPVSCSITAPATHPYVIQKISATNPQEWTVSTTAVVGEDEIDFNDGSTVDLTIECDDAVNPVITGTFTVSIEDSPPVVAGVPATVTLNEGFQTAAASLGSFTCTDGDDGCTCSVDDTAKFEIQGTYPNYELWPTTTYEFLVGDTGLTVTVTCTDGTTDVTNSFDVTVINAPPVIDNLDDTHSSTIQDDFDSATDTLLFTITVSDPEPDNCSTTNPKFTIDNSAPPSYDLYLVAGADLDFNDASPELVVVTCSDVSGATATGTYTVPISDAPPVISGLPGVAVDDVSDAITTATPLTGSEFTCTDSDDTCTCYIDPTDTAADGAFEVLTLSAVDFMVGVKDNPQNLDASVTPSYTLPIICDDGDNTVTETKVINMLNEPPVFKTLDDGGTVSVTVDESETTGRVIYTEYVDDTTKLYCYRTDPKTAPGILLEVIDGTAPTWTTELRVKLQDDPRLDFESGTGVMTLGLTCEDKETAVSKKLTIVIDNAAPTVTNPGGSFTLKETIDPTKPLALKDIHLELYDKGENCQITNAESGDFDIVKENNLNVLKFMGSGTALDAETKSVYNLEYECYDAGGLTTTDTFTVNVENVGPLITNTEMTITVREDLREAINDVLILPITTSEPANNCYQASSETDFIVKLEPGSSQWGIFYKGGSKLDFDAKRKYPITVRCEDDTTAGEERKFDIVLIKNEDPVFTNIVGGTTVEIPAKTTMQDDEVFEVTTSDPEDDPVNVTLLSCSCPDCPFEFIPNSPKIITTMDLATYTAAHLCALSIQINDDYNTPKPKTLVLQIKDANTVPKITWLPKVTSVLESRPVDDVIYTITRDKNFKDPDVSDTEFEFNCVWEDPGQEYFECDRATGEIRIIKELDYETQQQSYDVEITVSDQWNTSEPVTMQVNLLDEVEPMTFTKKTYTLTHDEGKAGDMIGCPSWEIEDDEVWGMYVFSMQCPEGPGGVVMDYTTGCVRLTREWDLDRKKRVGLDQITCTVMVEETGAHYEGYSDTATLTINFEESDDIAPILDKRQYSFCAPSGSTSSSFSVSAFDNDVLAEHKNLNFETSGSSKIGFEQSGSNDGKVTIGDVSNYPAGTAFRGTLRVSDAAGNSDEAAIEVVVCDTPPTVVNTQTSNNNAAAASTTSSNDLLYWLIPAGLLLALMAGLLTFLCWRCWRNGACARVCGGRGQICGGSSKPKHRKITRVKETPPRPERTQPRTPSPAPPKEPAGKLPLVEMPITHYWGRNVGNLGTVTT